MSGEDHKKLAQISTLAQLVLDGALADLRKLAHDRDESLARLADLNRPFPESDLHPMAAAEAEIRFHRWADLRRAEVNLVLARQIVAVEEGRQKAQLAFGRATALTRLRDAKG